jgi:hypothetical protein
MDVFVRMNDLARERLRAHRRVARRLDLLPKRIAASSSVRPVGIYSAIDSARDEIFVLEDLDGQAFSP